MTEQDRSAGSTHITFCTESHKKHKKSHTERQNLPKSSLHKCKDKARTQLQIQNIKSLSATQSDKEPANGKGRGKGQSVYHH